MNYVIFIDHKILFVVADGPVIDTSPSMSKAAAGGEGGRGVLTCRARAPNVTFKWFREGGEITPRLAEDSKYQIIDKNLDPLTWQSQLTVTQVQMKDFGPYGCVAENKYGSHRHSVILVITSKPETPRGLRVLSTTYNSVMLSWQPGFNGGFQQYFRIRLRPVGSKDDYQYLTDIPSQATQFEVSNLQVDTQYTFNILAFNKLGESGFSTGVVQAKTASKYLLRTSAIGS